MIIKQKNNWLGNKLDAMPQNQLMVLFKEIAEFRQTGMLSGNELRNLEKEFSDNVSHTTYSECMRLIEDEVLFEISRRFYNLNHVAPSNAPLTLDEMREMGGKPYWHVGLQEDSPPPHWSILDSFYASHIEDYGYGKRWLAYRCELKEGES